MYLIIFANWIGHVHQKEVKPRRAVRIYAPKTYRKENIAHIHEDHNETSDPGKVPGIGEEHESDRDEVVRHHLDVVFSPRLGGQNEYPVDIERSFVKVVELDGPRQWIVVVRVSIPDTLSRRQHFCWEIVVNPLPNRIESNKSMRPS